MRITFTSQIRGITTVIEQAQKNIKQAKIDGLGKIAKESFNQVGNKYIVKGKYSTPSKSGKSLTYTTPPGANIKVKKTLFFNPKTKFRKVTEVAMFIKGKFVSRSGKYEELITNLSNVVYKEGSVNIGPVRVVITSNSLKVYADSNSEFYKIETMKRVGSGKIGPLGKTFRSVVNLWKKVIIKLDRR